MTVIINGDTGISGVNGSAANPAIKGSDADTGIHFGADTAAITTGGTDKVSIDSTGDATFSGTVKTSKVENASTSNGGLAIDASGHVQLDGRNYATSGALSNRNIIINGGCTINQYGHVPSAEGVLAHDGLASEFYLDRFMGGMRKNTTDPSIGASAYEAQIMQSTDHPPGHKNSLMHITTTAEPAIDFGEYYFIAQKIEGSQIQHLEYGTASAKSLTLSFWVKSSITGTFAASFYVSGESRSINRSYTIDTADTWEYKTVTFSGDTGNEMGTAASSILWVVWHLAAGSQHNTGPAATTWATYNTGNWAGGLHQQNGVITTANANFRLSGVQLELGEQATDFEHITDHEQLHACQRYVYVLDAFYGSNGYPNVSLGSGSMVGTVNFPVYMRTSPSLRNATTINMSSDKWNASGATTRNYRPVTNRSSVRFSYLSTDNSNTNKPVDYFGVRGTGLNAIFTCEI
jgi:hypothetical protein